MAVVLLSIDTKSQTCRRYVRVPVGFINTDIFVVETELTMEKVESMRENPETTGVREPEAA